MRAGWLIGVSLVGGMLGPISASAQYARADIEYGRKLYGSHCAICHGSQGDTVAGVDFASGHFRNASSDQELVRIINGGIAGTAMPPGNYGTAELTGLIAYLRNIRGAASETPVFGDAGRGRAIFEGKGNCLRCHRVGNRGSRVAPDLSDVGTVLTAGAIERSLLDPTAAMWPMNQSVRAVTKEGGTFVGRRLNEDTVTIQLLDEREQLVSLLKEDLRQYDVVKQSVMPSYKSTLSSAELSDLAAYLLSLKEAP